MIHWFVVVLIAAVAYCLGDWDGYCAGRRKGFDEGLIRGLDRDRWNCYYD